jgi:hypothetical protein
MPRLRCGAFSLPTVVDLPARSDPAILHARDLVPDFTLAAQRHKLIEAAERPSAPSRPEKVDRS